MTDTPMSVVPEDQVATRGIINLTGEGTLVIRGPHAGSNATCGNCGARLIEGMPLAEFRKTILNAVIRCPACEAVNE